MARRAQGLGSFFRIKTGANKGLWCGVVVYPKLTGQRRARREYVYDRDRVKAKKEWEEKQRIASAGLASDSETMTTDKFLDLYLDRIKPPAVRDTTWQRYEQVIRIHIKPRIGSIRLRELTAVHLDTMYRAIDAAVNEKTGKKNNARTAELAHVIMATALKKATRPSWRLIERNVALDVDKPKYERAEFSPWTDEEAQAFLAAARTDPYDALYKVALCAPRQAEAFGLRWHRIKLAPMWKGGSTLQVAEQLQELKGQGLVVTKPKTKKSRRTIPLPVFVVAALRLHRMRQKRAGRYEPTGYVFLSEKGKLLRKGNFSKRQWKTLLVTAEVRAIRFHDLRHTAATLLIAGGADMKTVQEILGHATIGITGDTYVHAVDASKKSAVVGLDRQLSVRRERAPRPVSSAGSEPTDESSAGGGST